MCAQVPRNVRLRDVALPVWLDRKQISLRRPAHEVSEIVVKNWTRRR